MARPKKKSKEKHRYILELGKGISISMFQEDIANVGQFIEYNGIDYAVYKHGYSGGIWSIFCTKVYN